MRDRQDRRSRNAYTLIELIATLSLLLMIGIAAASMLGVVTQVAAETSQHRQAIRDVTRLDRQFRTDIRNADSVELSGEQTLQAISLNRAIRYRFQDNPPILLRELTELGRRSVEQFQLPANSRPTFALSDVLTLQITAEGIAVGWLIEVRKP